LPPKRDGVSPASLQLLTGRAQTHIVNKFRWTSIKCEPSGGPPKAIQSPVVLVALFVCLAPTTIGGLLSAIGIAGMDRLVQRNVLAIGMKQVLRPRTRSRAPVGPAVRAISDARV
jgi:hypothetical protein